MYRFAGTTGEFTTLFHLIRHGFAAPKAFPSRGRLLGRSRASATHRKIPIMIIGLNKQLQIYCKCSNPACHCEPVRRLVWHRARRRIQASNRRLRRLLASRNPFSFCRDPWQKNVPCHASGGFLFLAWKRNQKTLFSSGLPSVGAGNEAITRKPLHRTFACTSFGASARRDDMRASPGSCTPRSASSVPAVVVATFAGDRKGRPCEVPETGIFSIIRVSGYIHCPLSIVHCPLPYKS